MLWIIVLIILMIPLTSILLDSQLGRALANRVEGHRLTSGDTVTQERIAYLESEVERLQTEIDRVSEESQFVQKLLSDRRDDAPRLSDGADGESEP